VPWTADNPPSVAKNKSQAERVACVKAANAALADGKSDEDAIFACIGAMNNVIKAELGRVNRDLDRLVQALLDGTPARTIKDRMAQLEARKEMLEAQLARGEDVKVAVHPNMAATYRERVANLRIALAHEDSHIEAAALIRTLVDRIELAPVVQDGRTTLSITLHGALADATCLPR
jgi:hypothetical protein